MRDDELMAFLRTHLAGVAVYRFAPFWQSPDAGAPGVMIHAAMRWVGRDGQMGERRYGSQRVAPDVAAKLSGEPQAYVHGFTGDRHGTARWDVIGAGFVEGEAREACDAVSAAICQFLRWPALAQAQ